MFYTNVLSDIKSFELKTKLSTIKYKKFIAKYIWHEYLDITSDSIV